MNAWQGQTVVILASGPSLTVEQCEAVRLWHAAGNGRVIAINTTYKRAPWADVLYGCDLHWWRYEIDGVRTVFKGQLWTQNKDAARKYGLHHVVLQKREGLSRQPGVIYAGGGFNESGNGAYQAMNLAYLWGAARMILLGVDMKMDGERCHWHPPHVLYFESDYRVWLAAFPALAKALAAEGVEVLNATPGSALKVFPHVPLEEALECQSLRQFA